jgi:hypothetical protein
MHVLFLFNKRFIEALDSFIHIPYKSVEYLWVSSIRSPSEHGPTEVYDIVIEGSVDETTRSVTYSVQTQLLFISYNQLHVSANI